MAGDCSESRPREFEGTTLLSERNQMELYSPGKRANSAQLVQMKKNPANADRCSSSAKVLNTDRLPCHPHPRAHISVGPASLSKVIVKGHQYLENAFKNNFLLKKQEC